MYIKAVSFVSEGLCSTFLRQEDDTTVTASRSIPENFLIILAKLYTFFKILQQVLNFD